MNPATPLSPDSHIAAEFTGNHRHKSIFSDHHHDYSPNHQANVPLLHQPSYSLSSKSTSNTHDDLRHFRISLKWCLLDHSSAAARLVSYLAFAVLALIAPALAALAVRDPAADPICLNKLLQLPETGLAAIGFLTLSRFLRRHGLRQLLFLDALGADSPFVRRRYAAELDNSFRRLALILFPAFFVELAHKIIFFSTVTLSVPFLPTTGVVPVNSVLFVLVLSSWVYRSGVFLLACVVFRLTCELQILRFEGFQKMFEGVESDCEVMFGEHVRIRKQLWATSHRYRFFIIGSLVTITVCQFGALLLVFASKTDKNFLNSGDLVVCSVVQISGFFLCLVGAARITHRAQRIVSIATRWNMLVTCATSGPDQFKAHAQEAHADPYCGETDSDSDNFISVSPHDPSSLQTRQALVAYLEHNNGGITLFGFALDRGLLHTLFAFEFSLVLWILSKVVVLS
ncbi:hypothetical protein TIFTF001_037487 [Ficus carica]|uniref:Uncharacterized protein n=1 Tax=Ficus carica TaxID=3494 RepID=A0AA88E8U4_FICCA|nr:hypothetical protein TIFTF001_037486 [Ficus carica]GMN68434.1 hypothetical protein TIFTF001_037487 [Ficus carica]